MKILFEKFNLNDLTESDFQSAWSKETCHPSYREKWSENNPATGQCLVTALVVQDYFGGDLYSCTVGRISHFVNMIDGKLYDFTKSQFGDNEVDYKNLKLKDRSILLKNKDTKQRYELLKSRINL